MNWGVGLILLFVAAAAARDVFFGHVFQQYRFFDIVLVSFSIATLLFGSVVLSRQRAQLVRLKDQWGDIVRANIGTAAAWLSFFVALKTLEPAIVNTIHTGMGSVTLVGLGAMGWHISRPVPLRPLEVAIQAGVLFSLLALSAVVLLNVSGLTTRTASENLIGLVFAFASGVFISLTSDVTRRMHDNGITAEAVLAVRFFLMIGIAAGMHLVGTGEGAPLTDAAALARVTGAALVLIVAPLYALQLGLVRISAVGTWIILALGPCLVFAAQAFDGRLHYSPYTLACIIAYSALVIVANAVREWSKRRAIPAPG